MSRATSYENLKSVRSVVDKWQGVRSEHLERWREIVIGHFEYQRDIRAPQSPEDHKDALSGLFRALSKMGSWQEQAPPEFEFHTGIVLTEQQRKDFDKGNTGSVTRMARRFTNDAFGDLLRSGSYKKVQKLTKPSATQFAAHHWHRDPTPVALFVTNALPMKLVRGAVSPDFSQQRNNLLFVSLGEIGDLDMIKKIDQWAEDQGRLVEMHTNEIVIDVGRSWHCPAINTTEHPIPRVFLRGPHNVRVACTVS